jgi:hypothetical protein
MNYRFTVAILGLAAIAAGSWWYLQEGDAATHPASEAAKKEAAAPGDLAPRQSLTASSVLNINPRAVSRAATAAPQRKTLFNEFLTAKTYRPLYDRLKNSPEGQTPEGWYVMYQMLRQCATVPDRTGRAPPKNTSAEQRDQFVASLPLNDSQRDKRIEAFDAVSTNKCAGMEGITVKQAELDKMLASAAAGGDAKAQALQLEQSLWAQRRAAGPDAGWGRNTVTVTDTQFDTLRQIAASRDPEAMVIAGRVMSGNWADFSLRIGTDGQPIEPRAFNQAWQLLACDYGYPCDATNTRVQSGCAYQGHCNAQSLPDFIFYYGASPNDSQLMSQYQDILRNAIETGNWSQLTVARGANNTNTVHPNPMWRGFPGG